VTAVLGVTVLGTGSPIVDAKRAGPAALITYQRGEGSPVRHYLVDAGRWVGLRLEQAGVPWPHLDAVFFTHHHMDHNVGWSDVMMSGWQMGRQHRWRIFGPPFTGEFCAAMENAFSYDRARRFSLGSEDGGLHDVAELERGGIVLDEDGLRVTAAVVPHGPCVPSFAFRFDAPGRSIVISGDCRPSEALVELAAGADVLVHEVEHRASLRALLEAGGMPDEAQERICSNMSELHTNETQLGDVARAAGVATLMLTHYMPATFDPAALTASISATFGGDLVLSDDLTTG
jgi:ribonuclease BN (tRNA processing enzyme)